MKKVFVLIDDLVLQTQRIQSFCFCMIVPGTFLANTIPEAGYFLKIDTGQIIVLKLGSTLVSQ